MMKFSDKLKSTNIVLRVKVPGTFTADTAETSTAESSGITGGRNQRSGAA